MLSADSSEIRDLVEACEENRNLARSRHGASGYRIIALDRRKYVAIDEKPTFEGQDCAGRSGRFLVDRETAEVFTIRGYGQRGYRVGTVASLTEQFREGSATFNDNAGAHWETGRSHVAAWPTPRPAEALRLRLSQGGAA